MKSILFSLLLAIGLASCSPERSSIDELSDLVVEMKENAASYTCDDWDAVTTHYMEILEELKQYRLTLEQQKEISQLKSQVTSIFSEHSTTILKQKAEKGLNLLKDFGTGLIETADSLLRENKELTE